MATFLVDFLQDLNGIDCHMTFHYNNLTLSAGTPTAPTELANNFDASFVPLINALQSDIIQNTSIYVRDLGAPATAVTIPSAGGGLIVGAPGDTNQPSYVANISRVGTAWIDVVTSTPYIGVRPGRSGRVFMSGLMEDWQDVSGGGVPGSLTTEWAAFLAKWLGTLTLPTGGVVLNHVIWSDGKSALGGLPARNPLIADVIGGGFVELTRLKTRR